MTMLVHLIDDRQRAAVKRSGIRGQAWTLRSGGQSVEIARAVFAMPVLPNYFVTHQWLRELKRNGMRTVAGIHFKQRSDAMIWVGRYDGDHRHVPLGHAVSLIMAEPDPRGWQVVIPRSIPASAIHAVRAVPQVVGWRYFPESHDRGPWKCLCDFCVPTIRGNIKSMALRRRLLASQGAEMLNIGGDVERVVRPKRRKRAGGQNR
jgi:hypothetical protein